MKYYRAYFLKKGKRIEDIIKADNKADAIIAARESDNGKLIKLYEIPMPLEEKLKFFTDLVKNKLGRKKVDYSAYISALRQLAVMLKAGISLKIALEDIGNNTEDKLIKELFLYAAESVNRGKSLNSVFKEYEAYLGGLSVAMIKLGEQTGDLVFALEGLANIYDKMNTNKKKMVKALRYPIITLIAISIAFTVLITYVVPKFKDVFNELGANLPLPTILLLKTEYVLTHFGPLVFGGLVLTIIIIIFLYKTDIRFKTKVDELLLKTYLIKDIILYATLSRFLLVISALIRSGIPLLDALQIAEGIVGNEVIKNQVGRIIAGINQGRKISEMMIEEQFLDFIALRMISAGEEAGELDTMLQKAAEYYEEKFDAVVDNMQAAIEPIMLTIIGGMVLWLALGIFMPMWNLASAAKGGG